MTGLTVRTLRYFDQIGLFSPRSVHSNNTIKRRHSCSTKSFK
nr:hypothetical protein [Paenibacillus sp. 19GGS1-52]